MTVTTATPAASKASTPRPRAGRGRIDWSQPVVYVVALAVVAVAIGPVIYVFISGFRTNPDFFTDPAGTVNVPITGLRVRSAQ